MSAVQAFKTRALTGSILEALTARPHELTFMGKQIAQIEARAKELGGLHPGRRGEKSEGCLVEEAF